MDFKDYCSKRNCTECPFNGANPKCDQAYEVVRAITGNGNWSAKKTLRMLEIAISVLYEHGTGWEEFTEYQKYCLDQAISNIIDAEE